MDDSVLFMQWTLSTLQDQDQNVHPPVPAAGDDDTIAPLPDQLGHSASLDFIVPGRPPVLESRRRWAAATSWSSGDTNSGWCDGSAAPTQPMTMSWNFSQSASASASASPRLTKEAMPINYAAGSRSSAAPYARDHTIAERKRREKISQRLIELSTVIPGLRKTDKATILGDAVRYVKELQENLRALNDGRSFSPVVLAKKPRVATPDDDEDAVLPAYYAPAANDDNAEIDARISGESVMVRIRCRDANALFGSPIP